MAKTNDVRSLLKAHDQASRAVEGAAGGGDLPLGTYQCVVEEPSKSTMIHQDKDNAVRARVLLKVVACADEDYVGRSQSKSWNLISAEGDLDETGVSYFKKDMKTMGVEIEGIGDADETMPGIIGAVVEISVQESKGDATRSDGTPYVNVYINNLITPASQAAGRTKKTAPKKSTAGRGAKY